MSYANPSAFARLREHIASFLGQTIGALVLSSAALLLAQTLLAWLLVVAAACLFVVTNAAFGKVRAAGQALR